MFDQTNTLTSRADTVTGTSGNDTIDASLVNEGGVAGVQTFGFNDVIDGGAGVDTITIVYVDAVTPVSIRNVENFIITDADAGSETLDFANVTGIQSIDLRSMTAAGDINNLQSIVALTLTNNAVDHNVDYAAAAVAGTADAQTVTLASVTGGTLTLDTGIESVTLVSAGNSANVLTELVATGVSTITITGAQNLTLTNALDANFTTVDGEAATGALTINAATAVVHNITTGSGNDTIDLSGTFVDRTTIATADTVNGGAGIDRLVLQSAEVKAVASAAEFANITNIETIVVSNANAGGTYTMAFLGAATTLEFDAALGAFTVIAASGNEIQFDAADADADDARVVTIAGTATTDSITFDVNGVDIAGAYVLNGVETLNIATSGTSLMDGDSVTLTPTAAIESIIVTGSGTFSLGAFTADVLNTSGLASTATFIQTAAAQAAVSITGGAAAETFIGSTSADIISAGAGNDVITGGNGNDTLTGGAGIDTFVFNAVATNGADVITDFQTGATDDLLNVEALAGGNVAGKVAIAANAAEADITTAFAVVFADGADGTGAATITDYTNLTQVAAFVNAGLVVADGEEFAIIINDLVNDKAYVYNAIEADGNELAAGELALMATITLVDADTPLTVDNVTFTA